MRASTERTIVHLSGGVYALDRAPAVTDVLLVPGAWHGAWAWDRLLPLLAAAGYRPRTVDLPVTGADGRGAGLQDHADHLRVAVESAPGPPVVVVHSYSGLVAQAALAAASRPVAHLVLLDAWLGADGDSMLSLAPQAFADHWRAGRVAGQLGDTLPPPSPGFVGVTDPADVALLTERLTPQPWATFEDPLRLPGPWLRAPTTAIVCEPASLPFERWAADRGLPVHRIVSGHDAMLTEPAALADLLLQILERR